MANFIFGLEWFVYGFVCGFLATPAWRFLTKCIEEYKLAQQQWHRGPDL
jgi:hypothetical protein